MRNIHDRFFKAIYSQREYAEAHMHAFLDREILGAVRWSSFQAAPNETVAPRLSSRAGDLRYRADGVARNWVFRLMYEAQSAAELDMPLRCAEYAVFDIQAHRAERRQLGQALHPLPVVYPMVLYHGEPPW